MKNPEYNKLILNEIATKAKEFGLSGLEKIRKVSISNEPFKIENDLMTPTYKMKRNVAKKYFAKEIEDMYS